MPSAKVLEQKQQMVADLAEKLKASVAAVLVDYKGINVADDTLLRRELREAGVEYKVIKNTILGRAAKEAGYPEWESLLEGTTALALSNEDIIAPAKIVAKYAKKDKEVFNIKGGSIDGVNASVDEINQLASIPSKDVLLAQTLGTLLSPITCLAVVIKAIAEQKEAA